MINSFLDKTTLTSKIILHFTLITFILITIFFVIYNYLEEEVRRTHYNHLITVREIKKNHLINYFKYKESEIQRMANLPFIIFASKDLASSKNQKRYHIYDSLFKQHFNSNNSFENVYLVSTINDTIIYSLYSKDLENRRITQKDFERSNFQQLYFSLLIDKDSLKLSDFEFFAANGKKPSAFYAAPVYDENHNIISILFLQLAINDVEKIMTGNRSWKDEGLGLSGETYIVADDCKMRNNSRFFIEKKEHFFKQMSRDSASQKVIEQTKTANTNVLIQPINKNYCTKLFKNKHQGIDLVKDYRGVSVLSAYTTLDISGVNWVLLSEIDEEEVFASLKLLKEMMIITIIVIIVILFISTYYFSKESAKPLKIIIDAFKELGKGNLSQKIHIENREFNVLAKQYNKSLKQLKKLTNSVEYLSIISTTDYLTQVKNRQAFVEELNNNILRVTRTQEPFSLAVIDIDHFKEVNDTYGHECGDEVLKSFASLVKSSLRQTDVLARWGGEEFVILFINTHMSDANNVCEKIRKQIQEHSFEKTGHVTCSIGVTQFKDKDTQNSLIHRADVALYEAKASGRNCVVVR